MYFCLKKTTAFLFVVFGGILHCYAQQFISKQLKYNQELVVVELEDIDSFTLERSANSMLTIEMQGQPDKYSSLDISQTEGLILINTKDWEEEANHITEKFCKIQPLFNSYTLKIPSGARVEIRYAEGNFKATEFSGDLKLSVQRGDVSLNELQGQCEISMYAGHLNAQLSNTQYDITSNLGKLHTSQLQPNKKETSQQLVGVYGNPKNFLKVHAVRANIDLKATDNQ